VTCAIDCGLTHYSVGIPPDIYTKFVTHSSHNLCGAHFNPVHTGLFVRYYNRTL